MSNKITRMKTISRTFYSMPVNVIFFVGLPLFYFLFVLAYNPFGIDDFLAAGKGHYTLNLILTTLILTGVITLSRMLLFILRHHVDLNWTLYIIWCVGEVVFAGLMFSILLGIGWGGVRPYFSVMSLCILYLAGILVFPYSVNALAVQLYLLSKRAGPAVDEKTLIHFRDEQKRVKFIVASEAVLYIEAEENYVHIVHDDNGRIKDFVLRSSMRSMEEMLERHGLVRCHRSYFINAAHVDLVKKDSDGGYALAQLDRDGLPPVPVSKRYYESLTKLL